MSRHLACISLLVLSLLSNTAFALSSNADLETLTVRATGGATMVPPFSPALGEYRIDLPSDIRGIHIRGSAWVGASKLRINGEPVGSLSWHRVPLKPGENRIVINVLAPDGATSRDYGVTVHREDAGAAVAAFRKLVHAETETGVAMPYRLFVPPAYDPAKRYPLVVFLHGGGGNGSDNERHITGSDGATVWAMPAEQAKRPAFVLAAQARTFLNPDRTVALGGWGVTRDHDGQRYMAEALRPSADLKVLPTIIERVMAEYSIDRKRVYATGFSQGGFGTWNLGVMRPDLFAALVPICGGADPRQVSRLVTMPIWAFHAEDDQVVPVRYSRDTIAALRQAGGQPLYTEFPLGTFFDPDEHSSWVPAYRSEAMREWLFRQAKP